MYTESTIAPLIESIEGFLSFCLRPFFGSAVEASTSENEPKVMLELNDTNFQPTLKSDKPVLVDFFATWCQPCKRLAPVLVDFAKKHESDLIVAKVDIEAAPDLAIAQDVEVLPTLILFKDGKPLARRTGFASEAVIEAWVKESLGKTA